MYFLCNVHAGCNVGKPIKTFVHGLNCFKDAFYSLQDNQILSIEAWFVHEQCLDDRAKKDMIYADLRFYGDYFVTPPLWLYKKVYEEYFTLTMANFSRHDSYTGYVTGYPEAGYLFQQYISYLYAIMIKKEIQLIVIGTPHEIADVLLQALAEHMGIECIIVSFINYMQPKRFFLHKTMAQIGKLSEFPRKVSSVGENTIEQFGLSQQRLSSITNGIYQNRMNAALNLRNPLFFSNFLKHARRKKSYAKFLIENFTGREYVFFPLHYQPEAAICAWANHIWDNQVLLITTIAQKLPKGVLLLLKESPAQTFYFREKQFFDILDHLGNVRFVKEGTPSCTLYEGCLCALTVSGTIGWEVLRIGKPVIYTGYPLYCDAPGAYELADDLDMQYVFNKKFSVSNVKCHFEMLIERSYIAREDASGEFVNCDFEYAISDYMQSRNII